MDEDYQPHSEKSKSSAEDVHVPNKRSRKKKVFILGLIFVILIVGLATYVMIKNNSESEASLITATPSQAEVSITSTTVVPSLISVAAGSQVTWINNDTAQHQIASESIEGFESSIILEPGESYSFIFEIPGTYLYYDQLNPQQLQGTVEVK